MTLFLSIFILLQLHGFPPVEYPLVNLLKSHSTCIVHDFRNNKTTELHYSFRYLNVFPKERTAFQTEVSVAEVLQQKGFSFNPERDTILIIYYNYEIRVSNYPDRIQGHSCMGEVSLCREGETEYKLCDVNEVFGFRDMNPFLKIIKDNKEETLKRINGQHKSDSLDAEPYTILRIEIKDREIVNLAKWIIDSEVAFCTLDDPINLIEEIGIIN